MMRHLGIPYSNYRIGSGQRWVECSPRNRPEFSCEECPIRFKCWTMAEHEEIPITEKERLLFKPEFV